MRLQRSRSCTIVIPRSGKKSLKLSVQLLPLALGASIAIISPLAWLGRTFYTLHKNNSELSESTAEVLEELEDLDAEVEKLQERAGLKNEQQRSERLPQNLTFRPQGGKGGALIPDPEAAASRLQIVREQLPKLAKRLEAKVKPALEKTLKDEEARFVATPQGMPVAGIPEISSEFGPRPGVFGGAREMHNGMDFLGPHGTPIYATGDGVVSRAAYFGGFGNTVEIQHGYGYRSLYAHMTKLAVPEKAKVKRGQIIGFMGSTGRSSGTHLHYTIYKNDKAIDPKSYILADVEVSSTIAQQAR
ncbi:M23 family metallopeptidase [Acaryochloris thomasi]|nr:M23 family metallopeptidase [Acaryochloris thomasi]